MTIEIPLTKGRIALIDEEYAVAILPYKWQVRENGNTAYAQRSSGCRKKRVTIPMHRAIMGARPGERVDHINRNGLDNRRKNLRIASRSLNIANSAPKKGNRSGFKGVTRSTAQRGFFARIQYRGVSASSRVFADPKEAALLRDEMTRFVYGLDCFTNFPDTACPDGLAAYAKLLLRKFDLDRPLWTPASATEPEEIDGDYPNEISY